MKKTVFTTLLMLLSVWCMAADKEIPLDRKVDIKGVEYIKTQSSVTIHFAQGSESTVLVKENGRDRSQVRVSGNTLIIEMPALANYDGKSSRSIGGNRIVVGSNSYDVRTEVTLTLPRLREVENSGSLTFNASTNINTVRSQLKLNNSGSMRVNLGNVSGTEGSNFKVSNNGSLTLNAGRAHTHLFNIDNWGSFTADFRSVTADSELNMNNSGVLTLTLPESSAQAFVLKNYGSLKIKELAVRAGSVRYDNSGSDSEEASIKLITQQCKINNSGVLKNNFDVHAAGGGSSAILDFYNYGSITSHVKFSGERASFISSGAGSITTDVQCNTLKLNTSGTCRLTASGKTGSAETGGLRKSFVDVSQLHCGSITENFNDINMPQHRDTERVRHDGGNQYRP